MAQSTFEVSGIQQFNAEGYQIFKAQNDSQTFIKPADNPVFIKTNDNPVFVKQR